MIDMIISETITAIYQKRQTGKRVYIRDIKYNVYNFIKAEEYDIKTIGKEKSFLTYCTNIFEEGIDMFDICSLPKCNIFFFVCFLQGLAINTTMMMPSKILNSKSPLNGNLPL